MGNKDPADIVFLPVLTTIRSVRQSELVRAEVRAHTAKLIHRRRKQKEVPGQSTQPPSAGMESWTSDFCEALLRKSQLSTGISGSSDPFQSFPIKITPEINQVIALARDVLVPSLFIPSFARRLSFGVSKSISFDRAQFSIAGASVSLDLLQFKKANEGVAAAWLSGHMALLASLGFRLPEHDISIMELQLRTRSLELLREELAVDTEAHPFDLLLAIQHIMLLFQADCKRRDTNSASIHGPVLLDLMDKVTDNTQILHLLILLMFGNADLAATTLSRPVITLRLSMMERLSEFWASASSLVKINDIDYKDVHPSIENPTLREVSIRLRALLSITKTPLPVIDASEKARGLAVYCWAATQTFNDMCDLLNLYHDLMEDALEPATPGRRLTEACIALSLLQALRKSIHEADVDGRDLRDASHVILPKLQEILQQALEAVTSDEQSHYADVYFWMFFVGAQNEQRHVHEGSRQVNISGDSSSTWFTGMLLDQAQLLEVETWNEARRILEHFVLDQNLTPDGDSWFELAIAKRRG